MVNTNSSNEIDPSTPQSLVNDENVKKALAADKGPEAKLISWFVEDFTKKGDNYACVVSSVKITYSLNDQLSEVTHIVKLNPFRKLEGFETMWPMMFFKEINVYKELVPEINAILTAKGQRKMQLPHFIYGSLEEDREIIFLEDLRSRDYKLFDRLKGMDLPHATLVLQELGKLHASSILLSEKYAATHEDIISKHSYLKKDMFDLNEEGKDMLPIFEEYIDNSVTLLDNVGGYEKVIFWLKSLKPELIDILGPQMKSKICNVICHGDCWNNNALFRYDDLGNPIDVMLLDLQLCRYASPGTDLNYFLYSSLEGCVRKPNLNHLLSIYHNSFMDVMNNDNNAHQAPFFSQEEIKKEFKSLNKFGAITAMMLVPVIMLESEEAPDLNNQSLEEAKEQMKQKILNMTNHPLLKRRYLPVFEELTEYGIID